MSKAAIRDLEADIGMDQLAMAIPVVPVDRLWPTSPPKAIIGSRQTVVPVDNALAIKAN